MLLIIIGYSCFC
ncbi:hypothetical protein CN470_11800 [Bacillus cereus]|nr:hypothetical protein CN470_11800 [Bacillus cereus]